MAEGQSKKLHYPWKGSFYILKRISDCDYIVESTAGKHIKSIVHFNRLKLCKPGALFHHILSVDGELRSDADPASSQQP